MARLFPTLTRYSTNEKDLHAVTLQSRAAYCAQNKEKLVINRELSPRKKVGLGSQGEERVEHQMAGGDDDDENANL